VLSAADLLAAAQGGEPIPSAGEMEEVEVEVEEGDEDDVDRPLKPGDLAFLGNRP